MFLCLEPRLAVQLIQFVTNSDYETSRFIGGLGSESSHDFIGN